MRHVVTYFFETEFSKCMSLWTRTTAKSQKYGSWYVLGPMKSKEHEKEATTTIIILACSLGLSTVLAVTVDSI